MKPRRLARCFANDSQVSRTAAAIATEHTTDPDERRAIAETMANDAMSLAKDSQDAAVQAATADAQTAKQGQIMSHECAQMQLELEAKSPAGSQ